MEASQGPRGSSRAAPQQQGAGRIPQGPPECPARPGRSAVRDGPRLPDHRGPCEGLQGGRGGRAGSKGCCTPGQDDLSGRGGRRTPADLRGLPCGGEPGNARRGRLPAERLRPALRRSPGPEATAGLARVAVFSTDETVRATAIEALAVRREEDATDVLVAGLLPLARGRRSFRQGHRQAETQRPCSTLQAMLDAPDPRGPRAESVAVGRRRWHMNLVRVNHLRNCMLCHAPAQRGETQEQRWSPRSPCQRNRSPTPAPATVGRSPISWCASDVTYLRQDFSAKQNVSDWTSRLLSRRCSGLTSLCEAACYAGQDCHLQTRLRGVSPYRRTAARPCELTGRDFEARAVTQREDRSRCSSRQSIGRARLPSLFFPARQKPRPSPSGMLSFPDMRKGGLGGGNNPLAAGREAGPGVVGTRALRCPRDHAVYSPPVRDHFANRRRTHSPVKQGYSEAFTGKGYLHDSAKSLPPEPDLFLSCPIHNNTCILARSPPACSEKPRYGQSRSRPC